MSFLQNGNFAPPFCPNPKCSAHLRGRDPSVVTARPFYYRNGRALTRRLNPIQRFRCKGCSKSFSEATFVFSYRFKKPDRALSSKIFHTFALGASNRQIAHYLNISEHCVRGRLQRMSRWALLIHRDKLSTLKIKEALCYDGLENFAGSQYDPNHINQAIGRDSLFIYDFNFAPLNRKGYMSDRQKIRKQQIELKDGRYPSSAIRWATSALLSRLIGMREAEQPLVVCSDEHYQYRRSIQHDLPHHAIDHVSISSRATRNYQNILFAVNHCDLLIRHRVGAFTRETISFSKTHARMCQKFALFMVHKNYFAIQFSKKQVRRARAHVQSPAQSLGLQTGILKFHEFFDELRTPQQVPLPEDWMLFVNDQVPYQRVKRRTQAA